MDIPMPNLQPPPPYNSGSNELVSLQSTRSESGNFATSSRSATTNLPQSTASDSVAKNVPNTVINLTNSSDVVIG
jgi:hypothetical protein